MVEGKLIRLFGTTNINKMHLLFGNPFHKKSTVKRAWLGVVLSSRKFLGKRASEDKTRRKDSCWLVGSVNNPKSRMRCYKWYQSSTMWFRYEPSRIRCACNTQGWRGRGVVTGAQGITMSDSRQLLDQPNHIGMRGILRSYRYKTTWLKESL
jgi:hypothetical protein